MLRKLHLIANPAGGVGDNVAIGRLAEEFLLRHEIETALLLTEHPGHALEIVESLECGPDEAICGIGGDGTMHELVNGMMRRSPECRVPLTLLPGGTGNSFLQDLGCLESTTVLERLVKQSRRSIDLFEISFDGIVRYGFNLVGWGIASSANLLAESLRFLGRRRYDIATVIEVLRNRKFKAVIETSDTTIDSQFTFLALCNTVHTGAGMKLAPQAQLDDGQLDLIYVEEASRRQLLRLFSRLPKGKHLDDPILHYSYTNTLKVTTEESIPINLDGELIEPGSFEVKILPRALDILL